MKYRGIFTRYSVFILSTVLCYRLLRIMIPRKEFYGMDANSLLKMFFDLTWFAPIELILYGSVIFICMSCWTNRSCMVVSSFSGVFIGGYYFVGIYPIAAWSALDKFFLATDAPLYQFLMYLFVYFLVVPLSVIIAISYFFRRQ